MRVSVCGLWMSHTLLITFSVLECELYNRKFVLVDDLCVTLLKLGYYRITSSVTNLQRNEFRDYIFKASFKTGHDNPTVLTQDA